MPNLHTRCCALNSKPDLEEPLLSVSILFVLLYFAVLSYEYGSFVVWDVNMFAEYKLHTLILITVRYIQAYKLQFLSFQHSNHTAALTVNGRPLTFRMRQFQCYLHYVLHCASQILLELLIIIIMIWQCVIGPSGKILFPFADSAGTHEFRMHCDAEGHFSRASDCV